MYCSLNLKREQRDSVLVRGEVPAEVVCDKRRRRQNNNNDDNYDIIIIMSLNIRRILCRSRIADCMDDI